MKLRGKNVKEGKLCLSVRVRLFECSCNDVT